MVGIGLLMLALGIWSLLLRWRGRLYDAPLMHRAAVLMGPAGFVAVLAGWITTEVGRQPYTVYGLLTTAQSPRRSMRRGRGLVAGRVHPGLFRAVRRRRVLHPAPDGASRRTPASPTCRPTSRSAPPASCRRRRMEQAGAASRRSEAADGTRPPLHLGRPDRLRGPGLCRARRLRSRRRHPVPLCPRRGRPRPDDELGRARLGRQRDLAGARRRRPVRRLPARLRRDHAGALRARSSPCCWP